MELYEIREVQKQLKKLEERMIIGTIVLGTLIVVCTTRKIAF